MKSAASCSWVLPAPHFCVRPPKLYNASRTFNPLSRRHAKDGATKAMRNNKCLHWGVSLAALLVGCVYPADDSVFDPRALQQNERGAAMSSPARTMTALPTTLESPFLQT